MSLHHPSGAIWFSAQLHAIIGAFQTVQTIVQQAATIGGVITNALSSVAAIAAGNIGSAAGSIERALVGSLSVALTWLTKVLGLGGLGTKIRGIIAKVKGKLDGVLNKIVAKMKTVIEKLMGKGKEKPGDPKTAGNKDGITTDSRTMAQKQSDVAKAKVEAESSADKNWNNKGAFDTSLQSIKSKYKLTTIRYDQLDEFSGTVFAEINPTATTKKLSS